MTVWIWILLDALTGQNLRKSPLCLAGSLPNTPKSFLRSCQKIDIYSSLLLAVSFLLFKSMLWPSPNCQSEIKTVLYDQNDSARFFDASTIKGHHKPQLGSLWAPRFEGAQKGMLQKLGYLEHPVGVGKMNRIWYLGAYFLCHLGWKHLEPEITVSR